MLLLFQESMGDLHDPRSVELERAVTDATIHSAKKENTITFLTQHLHMFLIFNVWMHMELQAIPER